MFEALPGSGPLCGIKCQHGVEKVAEGSGLFLRPLVLLREHLKHAPRTELGDMLQVTWGEAWGEKQEPWNFMDILNPKELLNGHKIA